jgi:PBP1b-binding outer membrane lipoprotein LpoB
MLKRSIFLFLVILAGCNNQPTPSDKDVKKTTPVKSRARTVKPAANPWTTGSYAPKEGEKEGRKFVRLVTEGEFSDSTQNNSTLFAEVIVNKANAGILLHEMKKSSPAQKFSDPVHIKMTNSSGQELQITSARSWNSSGGIMIERNNNDYSQFRIFLLQSKGAVTVEIKDSGTKIYHFSINTDGFSDSFTSL